MTTISNLTLPFAIVEQPAWRDLIDLAQSAPHPINHISGKTVRSHLEKLAKNQQEQILNELPPNAKLSLSFDCWTSPFNQAFLAVVAYFINADWEYREVLLGFEFLQERHTGAYLAEILMDKVLRKYNIQDRVVAVTSDNASNNDALIKAMKENYGIDLIRSPCLAHVIQLSLNAMLAQMKAEPKNSQMEDPISSTDDHAGSETKISTTLKKVSSCFSAEKRLAFNGLTPLAVICQAFFSRKTPSNNICIANIFFSIRYAVLLSLSTVAAYAKSLF